MKYIIDLEPLLQDSKAVTTLWIANGFRTLVFDQEGKRRLTPLSDDICIEQLRASCWMQRHDKEMYVHGYSDGLDVMKNTDGAEVYAEGLHDAWAVALKVVLPEKAGGKYTSDELREIFGVEFDYQCLQKYTPQEVIRKLSDYDEQKKKTDQEIRVGDEIESCIGKGEKYIVLRTYLNVSAETMLTLLHRGDGDIDSYRLYDDGVARFRKTGNRFPQVAELMTEIGGTDG